MRLVNTVKQGKYYLKIVLDSDGVTTNYIQKTKGCYGSSYSSSCTCIKCMAEVDWIIWSKNNKKAKNTCKCGEKHTLEIIDFARVARVLDIAM